MRALLLFALAQAPARPSVRPAGDTLAEAKPDRFSFRFAGGILASEPGWAIDKGRRGLSSLGKDYLGAVARLEGLFQTLGLEKKQPKSQAWAALAAATEKAERL